MIVDECITIFIAASLTTATATANTLCFMIQKPQIEKKLRESLAANFPSFNDKNASLEQLAAELSLEGLDLSHDDYMKLCFNEVLRIEPPVTFSATF